MSREILPDNPCHFGPLTTSYRFLSETIGEKFPDPFQVRLKLIKDF